MKRAVGVGVLAAALVSALPLVIAPPAWGGAPPETIEQALAHPHLPGEVLVKFRPEATAEAIGSFRDQLGAATIGTFRSRAERWVLGPGHTVAEAIEILTRSGAVAYAEPNYLVTATAAPDDPRYPELYGLHNTGQTGGTPGADIDAERAWDVSTGSSAVVVAVIDTGVDYNHPDLAANVWVNPGEIPGNALDDDGNGYVDDVRGWDFYNRDNDPLDDHSHGTHCAGTIGAVGNNAVGVVGVAWSVKILPVKFLGWDGYGSTADAILSVEYATALGVDVMSNSWGGGGFSQALLDAIQAASDAGILFVAAAGNDSTDNDLYPHYPSSYDAPNVVAVAATDHNDNLAYFSSYGPTSVDLAAPGVDTLSCLPGASYGFKSGTSMATPHVSGVAALIRSLAPDMDVVALKGRILDTVDPLANLAGVVLTGGRLNAFLAIAERDAIPPGAVSDLAIAESNSNSLLVTWTAPGDDDDAGRAVAYEVRWSEQPIDDGNFAAATLAAGAPRPKESGQPESMEVTGLQAGRTYFIALKTRDEWANVSALSNVASGATLPPPTFDSSPASFDVALLTGGSEIRLLTLRNAGVGTLDWTIPDPAPPGPRDWLTATPASGRLRAGEQADVVIRIDATDLDAGVYPGSVDVNTNDPDHPIVGHPVTLTVTGAPDILVTGAEIRLESSQMYSVDGAVTAHALPISVSPSGDGSLELIADGDYGNWAETATATAEGRTLGSVGAVGQDCTPAQGTFPIAAADLSALATDGVVAVEVRNAYDVNVFCATNRHQVILRYRGPGDLLDFGSPFVGVSRGLPLHIENRGTDTLEISSIASDLAEFVPSVSALSIPPHQSAEVTVTFTAADPGVFDGVLTILSNDGDEPSVTVGLHGEALVPPDIDVTPTSLSADLLTNETVTRTLTIANPGSSDLIWSLRMRQADGSQTSALEPEASPRLGSSGVAPEGFQSSASASVRVPGARVLLVQDVLPWNSDANERALTAQGVTFDRVTASTLGSIDLGPYQTVIVASDQTTSTYVTIAANMGRLEQFVMTGGILEFHAAGWGWNGGDASVVGLPGGMRIVWRGAPINYVVAPDHPVMAGIPSSFSGNWASHAYFSAVPDGAVVITTNDSGEPTLVEYRFGRGMVVAASQTLEIYYGAGPIGRILDNLVAYTSRPFADWIFAEPTEGTVPAGSSVDVTVTFDATDAEPGYYDAQIVIASNDPDETEVGVPARMHVYGVPDIVVSPSDLDFGVVYVGFPEVLAVNVANVGIEPLNVQSITSGDPAVSVDVPSFIVAPGASRDVLVVADPREARAIGTTLAIVSDDPNEGTVEVGVACMALIPPDVDLEPATIDVTTLSGRTESSTLTIRNLGGSDLTWSIDVRPNAAAGVGAPRPTGMVQGPGMRSLDGERGAPTEPRFSDGAHVLIVQDVPPWGSGANQVVLSLNGLAFDVVNASALATIDLSPYRLVIVASDQTNATYAALAGSMPRVADWVAQGGVLEFHGAAWGWYGGDVSVVTLPGGATIEYGYSFQNVIIDPSHPVVADIPSPFDGWPANQGQFTNLPGSAHVIITDEYGAPTLVTYQHGYGSVVGSTHLLEWAYFTSLPMGRLLSNLIPWAFSPTSDWLSLSAMSGVVPAGGSAVIEVGLDATDLTPNEYLRILAVASDDPDERERTAEVRFHVRRLRAEAGESQGHECSGAGGAEAILDGTGSEHMDGPGAITRYAWSEHDIALGDGPSLPIRFLLGTHDVTLRIEDATEASSVDQTRVVVVDTVAPSGRITSPGAGACVGPADLPVVVADDYVDECEGDVVRTYDPPSGPIVTAHGDHVVTLAASDTSGNAASPSGVAFTIDTVPPEIAIIVDRETFEFPVVVPFAEFFVSGDDDGASGGVAHEVLTIDDCVVFDGLTFGDGDGLLSDESVSREDVTICVLAKRCARRRWTDPVIAVTATDCGGNASTATMTVAGDFVAPDCVTSASLAFDDGSAGPRLVWGTVPGANAYQVVRGTLTALRLSGGLFVHATSACLGAGLSDTALEDTSVPASGEGFWYLVRDVTDGVPSSWDDASGQRVGSRDEGIAASGVGCP